MPDSQWYPVNLSLCNSGQWEQYSSQYLSCRKLSKADGESLINSLCSLDRTILMLKMGFQCLLFIKKKQQQGFSSRFCVAFTLHSLHVVGYFALLSQWRQIYIVGEKCKYMIPLVINNFILNPFTHLAPSLFKYFNFTWRAQQGPDEQGGQGWVEGRTGEQGWVGSMAHCTMEPCTRLAGACTSSHFQGAESGIMWGTGAGPGMGLPPVAVFYELLMAMSRHQAVYVQLLACRI